MHHNSVLLDEIEVPSFALRMKCSECGGKRVDARPNSKEQPTIPPRLDHSGEPRWSSKHFPKVEMMLTYSRSSGGMDATARVHRGAWQRGGVAGSGARQ
jgi:hypothetical protein